MCELQSSLDEINVQCQMNFNIGIHLLGDLVRTINAGKFIGMMLAQLQILEDNQEEFSLLQKENDYNNGEGEHYEI